MAMSEGYLNAIATEGGTLITHIGLVNAGGTELTGVFASHPTGTNYVLIA